MTMSETPHTIVVGADGSDLSAAALQWAVGQARMLDGRIVVVTGFDIPITIFIVPTYTDDDYARLAEKMLADTVSKAFPDGPPDVPVETRLVQQRPGMAVAQAADELGADMVVIGSHGQGELPGVHVGSVASYIVHHAPCPVLVYRRSDTGR